MNSPLLQFFVSYIRLNKQEKTPIYLQIARAIINAIHTKQVIAGNKLPGSRALSEKLYVHRKTVIAAYEELHAQGWVEIYPQRGAFVTSKKLKYTPHPMHNNESNVIKSNFTFEHNITLDTKVEEVNDTLFFTDGTADFRLSPIKHLNQQLTSISNKKSTLSKINIPFYKVHTGLQQQVLNYLRITKGFNASTEQILITHSYQASLTTTMNVLLRPGDKVIVTELGNHYSYMLLKQAGIELLTVPFLENDINLQELDKIITNNRIRAIYLQPNHLYPTTSSLSDATKHHLINLAKEHKFIIIEDDSGSNIHYSKNQLVTLKSLDQFGSVVYINSYADLLPPPYDLGFIVAPNDIIPELTNYNNALQRVNNYLLEETIAEFIREGYLLQYWQKLNKIYQKRKDNFEMLINEKLEQSVQIAKTECGKALWLVFNQKLPLLSIANYCKAHNLTLPTDLLYQNKKVTGLRLGFAHMNENEAEQAIHILSQAIYKYMYE